MVGTGGVSAILGTMVIMAGDMIRGIGVLGDTILGTMILGIMILGGMIRGTGLLMGIATTLGRLSRGFPLTEDVTMENVGGHSQAARRADGLVGAIIARA